MAEAMVCGTPVAALDIGAVREVVDDGITGVVFSDVLSMVADFDRVLRLDRRLVRNQAVARYGLNRMVEDYISLYNRMV